MIFITGATGCVGSYFLEHLLQLTEQPIYLLVRSSKKISPYLMNKKQVTLIEGTLEDIDKHQELLSQAVYVFHFATSWGGEHSFDVNCRATLNMLSYVNSKVCKRMIYFSTASIVNSDLSLDEAALSKGTEYIRSKAWAYLKLQKSPKASLVTTVFPSLIYGGSKEHPFTPLTRSMSAWPMYINILKYLKMDGMFHWMHSRDIALILGAYFQDVKPWPQAFVLGQTAVSVQALFKELTARLPLFQFPLPEASLLSILVPWMSSWDRHTFAHRFRTYDVTCPEDLGKISEYKDFKQLFANYSNALR